MRGALILHGSAVAIALANLSPLAAHPSIRSGVAIHVAQKAHATYVLFDGRDLRAHLIDMNGNEVRAWNRLGFPAEMIDPALTGGRRGHVLLHKEQTRKVNQALVEVDWDDRIVWEWGERAPGGSANQNHDVARLANGNTLVVSRRTSGTAPAPWHLGGTGESFRQRLSHARNSRWPLDGARIDWFSVDRTSACGGALGINETRSRTKLTKSIVKSAKHAQS